MLPHITSYVHFKTLIGFALRVSRTKGHSLKSGTSFVELAVNGRISIYNEERQTFSHYQCEFLPLTTSSTKDVPDCLKGRSHYSDNQSPTSNNHYFWGGCRRLSEVGKCLSMIGDWLSENYIDNLSPTSDNHEPPFFRVVFDGRQMVVDDRRAVLVGQRFSMQHQQPSTTKQGCHTKLIYI